MEWIRQINLMGRFFIARARVYSSALIALLFVFALHMVAIAAPTTLDPKTDSNVQAISNPKLQICLPAIDALSRSNDPAVVAPMTNALASEKRSLVRRYLVDALGMLRQPGALPALKNALSDSDAQVRESAVAALGLIGTPQAQRILAAQASREKDPAVKRHYAHQLQFSALPEARSVLKTYRNDKDAAVKKIASQSLDAHPEAK